jgi:hypothetical protein
LIWIGFASAVVTTLAAFNRQPYESDFLDGA